jgi:WD40 repeat protein
VAFSPDGTHLATASGDIARVWNLTYGTKLHTLRHEDKLVGVAFAPDGTRLATASRDGTAWVWVLGSELPILRHKKEVWGVAFTADGTRVATASDDCTVRIWDHASAAELYTLRVRYNDSGRYHDGEWRDDEPVWGGFALAPDGTRVATAGESARVWDFTSGAEVRTLRHEYGVWRVAFSPDGTRLATASFDDTARVWDLASGAELRVLPHRDGVVGVAFSPDGTRLATASGDIARVWNLATASNTARVWDLADGAVQHTLRHEGMVVGVAFSPDGTHLATASGDIARVWNLATASNTARVWDLADGAVQHTLRHEGMVVGVAFSPDGTRLATTSSDTARVWNLADGAELRALRHEKKVVGVAFSPDGTYLATASSNTARVWDLRPDAILLAAARTRVNRRLTADERRTAGLLL